MFSSLFVDGQLYSATAADFSGGDALIYRDTQRTEQFNAKQLNQPAFVSTVERNGYVFFFFREIALENCGKAIYSRVARVCKNDRGGQSPFRERWTSYLKTRLNCSTPGDFPFYFDELRTSIILNIFCALFPFTCLLIVFISVSAEGTTSIIDGLYQAAVNQKRQLRNYHTTSRTDGTNKNPEMRPSSLIYAVFTTPQNAIPGSAVCAFQVDDIIETFEGTCHYCFCVNGRIDSKQIFLPGDFKGQRDATSSWLPIPASEVPEPRPGKCVDDSRELPMRTVNFVIKMNTLMASSVPALYGQPLLTRVSSKHRFTSITTDAQVEALNGDRYDILFVGTDNGRVIKFINYLRTQTNENSTESNKLHDQQPVANLETVVITETQALPHSVPVKQMVVAKDQQSLIVVSTGNIISIPLSHCSRILRCRDCLNLQDPYCVWDVKNHECTSMSSVNEQNRMNFIQNLRLTINSSDICKRSGDDNYVDVAPSAKPSSANGRSLSIQPGSGVGTNSVGENSPHTPASTRGTVSSVGHIAPVLSSNDVTSNSVTNRANEISGSSIESNQIPPNFDAFGNDIENGELGIVEPRNLDAQTSVSASAKNDQMTAMATPIFSCVVFIVFIVGLAVGLIVRRLKFSHSPFDILRNGAGGGHHHLSEQHRNQLNYYDKTNRGLSAVRNTSGGNGKDINLLMNVMGPYIAAGGGNNANSRSSCTTAQTPNNLNKKDILELEFETKDRSHECKNSTEHLDMNDLKANANNNANNNSNCNNTSSNAPTAVIVNTTNTGTLQKVKKTYL